MKDKQKEIILKEMSLLLRDEDKCENLGELSDLMSKHADNILKELDIRQLRRDERHN